MNHTSIPLPSNADDIFRWDFTRLARRILYGHWKEDLQKEVRKQVGSQREQAWGSVDISANVFRSVCDNLAVLYDQEPIIQGNEIVIEELSRSGIWSLMKTVQRDCLGLREMLIKVDTNDDGLVFRSVPPDMVVASSLGDKPDQPVRIEEIRQWPVNGQMEWVWEVYDISNIPTYRIEYRDNNGNISDLTAALLGSEKSGELYPYRYSDGTPFIPYIVYHAKNTGYLWDPYSFREVVEGTLTLGVYSSELSHCMRNASWPQRYAIGVQLSGGSMDSLGGVQVSQTVVDPATVVMFESIDGNNQAPQIGQWSPGSDPASMMETITQYERRLVSFAGVNPADLQRASGDPRSGFALAITRDAQRQAQRQYEGQFRKGDLELIRKSAALLSILFATQLPEDGFSIAYQSIPRSAEEESAIMEKAQFLLDKGLITKEKAFKMIFPNEEYTQQQEESLTNG